MDPRLREDDKSRNPRINPGAKYKIDCPQDAAWGRYNKMDAPGAEPVPTGREGKLQREPA